MTKPRIAVFSGPRATIANSPTLVTGNKGRLPGERVLPGRYEHLAPQVLHEPVVVKIRKYSAHPLEEDAAAVYQPDGKDYYEVELLPEDGPYPLPYVARRANGSEQGQPFEEADLFDPSLNFGGRQFFYPDASRMFTEIDRTISGRDESGEGSALDRKADFEFIRVLPPGGYTQKGEKSGVDYFPYRPLAIRRSPRYRDLAHVVNSVQAALASGEYAGGIWLEGSPTVEETTYWLSLLIDTDLAIAGIAAQRPHGQLANDGDRNIVDAVDYVLSGLGNGIGAVGVQDERIYAAREFKKADDRPGNYKATGGHGGILGTVGPPVTIWYKPAYRHTASSDVNLSRLPDVLEFPEYADANATVRVAVKDGEGRLLGESIPRVHIVKYGAYMDEDETGNPDNEVDIMARIEKGLADQSQRRPASPQAARLRAGRVFALRSGRDVAAPGAGNRHLQRYAGGQGGPGRPRRPGAQRLGRPDHRGEQPGHQQGQAAADGRNAQAGPPAQGPRPPEPDQGRAQRDRRQGGGVPGDFREPLGLMSKQAVGQRVLYAEG